ncbi:RagB/SusD family nutrient uptake outer membrane protein [Cyclobacterium sp. 1_MG-2023]|uniref:RagB/SusD family nutrient uptake outer membrane protein n=1 Tax=Cyclobacterium sp. 1_MG-2023 TaxID=3062681 RepID=UPI0026E473A1|nr:RagB/SusD family nutrient uptake outer membrane protein [Cyclobacterium sp. 1_MG-2023]MDO6438148.1 RagB/SusD family nutrient uptake outer membrane protein [Cyclobacterium sp. 1_MG-2023]
MKNILIFNIVISFLLLFGCSDDYLEKSPPDKLLEEGFVNSSDRVSLAVNGTYQQLQVSDLYGDYLPKFIGVPSGEILLSNTTPLAINNFSFDASDTYLLNIYAAFYQGIKRANSVITEAPLVDMDNALKARYIAEAKFLRAFYYWNLTNMWGDVILLLETVENPDDVLVGKNTQAEIYEAIKIDLQDAIPALPASYESSDLGRVTKGAAQSLLGKAHLYTENYEEAESLFAEVIQSGTYNLMDEFDQIWNRNFENNSESIFEVQFADIGGAGTSTRNQSHLPGVNGGTGSHVATQKIVDAFSENDPRLGYSIFRDGDIFAPNLTTASIDLDYYKSTWSATGYNIRKGMVPILYLQGAGTNYPVIRFADVLLMYAEAANEMGKISEARNAVNRVRQRPSVNMPVLTEAETGTKEAMFAAIVDEREVELAFENHRFSDLRRWGLAEEELGPLGYLPKHRYFPFPQLEIDINPQLVQNTGW